jgi:hypothetical protein
LADHDNGLVLSIPRSKTNQEGTEPELVVLPSGPTPPAARCAPYASGPTRRHQLRPAAAARVQGQQGPGAPPGRRGAQPPGPGGSDPGRHRPSPLLGPLLRAGFVTYAHLRGASDRAIAHQSRHRSLATLGQYVRVHEAWQDNAATQLGLAVVAWVNADKKR